MNAYGPIVACHLTQVCILTFNGYIFNNEWVGVLEILENYCQWLDAVWETRQGNERSAIIQTSRATKRR